MVTATFSGVLPFPEHFHIVDGLHRAHELIMVFTGSPALRTMPPNVSPLMSRELHEVVGERAEQVESAANSCLAWTGGVSDQSSDVRARARRFGRAAA